MPEDDELARRVRKLVVEHAETRWLALRLDSDIQEIRSELRAIRHVQGEHSATLGGYSATLGSHTATLEMHTATLELHTAKLDEHSVTLQEHTARFDSVDTQLRSLTQMVGQVLERLDDR